MIWEVNKVTLAGGDGADGLNEREEVVRGLSESVS